MPAYSRPLNPRIGTDGQPILYTDEAGVTRLGEQGDYYVFAGVLTTNNSGLETVVRRIRARHYPKRAELKSKKMSVDARNDLLSDITALEDTELLVHVVVKPEIQNPDFLSDYNAFYKRCYTNLVKTALKGHTHGIHIITDRHHGTPERFRHFENCVRYVCGTRILSVNPVDSERMFGIQAADVVAGTLKKYLNGCPRHGPSYEIIKKKRVDDWNNVFPYNSKIRGRV